MFHVKHFRRLFVVKYYILDMDGLRDNDTFSGWVGLPRIDATLRYRRRTAVRN